jgi:hypothetical protein
MALYCFRISERLARVPEPLIPVYGAAKKCRSRRTRTRRQGRRQLRHESKSLRCDER